LEVFNFTENEDKYLKTLQSLNKEQLLMVKDLNKTEFEKLFNKPQNEVLQILIQAQINNLKTKGLEVLTDEEFNQYEKLQKHLIAVENQKQAHNTILIADENQKQAKQKETIDDIDETNKKLDELRGILLSNSKIQDNPKIKILDEMFALADKNRNQKEIQKHLEKIIAFLQNP
jgi:molybdopterin converting factor small subunit